MSAVGAPLIGLVVDKLGYRIYFIILSGFIFVSAHLTFAFIPLCDEETGPCRTAIVGMVLLGITYSIYVSSIWPSIFYVVPARTVGTAYGLTTAVQNAGLALIPLVVGPITEKTTYRGGYFWVNMTLGMIAILGILNAVWLFIWDKKYNHGRLNTVEHR